MQQCDQAYATAPGKWIKNCIQVYDQYFRTFEQQCAQAYVTGKVSGSERDQAIDAGLGLDYVINDKSKIGISYSQFIDKFTDTDSTKVYSIGFSHQF